MAYQIGHIYRFTCNQDADDPRFRGVWFEAEAVPGVNTVRVINKGTHPSVDLGHTYKIEGQGWGNVKDITNPYRWRSVNADEAERQLSEAPEFKSVPPRGNLKWVAVDLDSTLAQGVWTADNPTSDIGPLRPGVRAKVEELEAAGYKIVVHTSRSWTDYENIENWLNHNRIPFRNIVCGKLLAAVYIDDRALNDSESSWLPSKAKELHELGDYVSKARQEYEAAPQRILLNSESAARKVELLAAWDRYRDNPKLVGGIDDVMLAVQNFVKAEKEDQT